MRISQAIKKLQALQKKSPKAKVTLQIERPKKVGVTELFKQWATRKCEGGKTFTFLEACLAYEKIGGSAGTTTVLHRLSNIGARSISPGKAESHLRGEWTLDKEKYVPVSELIAMDPTFRDRYEALRRRIVSGGGLAPPPFEQVKFSKSWGNRGINLVVNDDDPDRRARITVHPRGERAPVDN